MEKVNELWLVYDSGRFAVAGRDITVGEVITVEKAIVSHMLPEYMGKLFMILTLDLLDL